MARKARTDDSDFLDEMIEDFSAQNPEFPALLAEAEARRATLRALADERKAQGMSQTQTAAAMNTSQSFVAKLETGASDALLSTAQRFAGALGLRMAIVFVDRDDPAPPVLVRRTRREASPPATAAKTTNVDAADRPPARRARRRATPSARA